MEEWESERYKDSIKAYQVMVSNSLIVAQVEEWKTNASLTFLNLAQTSILNGALLALALFCANLVKTRIRKLVLITLVSGCRKE